MYFCAAEGFGEPRSSLNGIRRGGFAHSRKTVRFKVYRRNASVYSSVQTSRNPDFDLFQWQCHLCDKLVRVLMLRRPLQIGVPHHTARL